MVTIGLNDTAEMGEMGNRHFLHCLIMGYKLLQLLSMAIWKIPFDTEILFLGFSPMYWHTYRMIHIQSY